MVNQNLSAAKSAKNDEFYTQYADIQKEVNAYLEYDPDVFKGKIFVLDHDTNANGRIDIEDLEWRYMKGDGDFRSDEVRKLRDEADIIVTNPPFSLFREFLAWIAEADKKFLIIGNMNAITYNVSKWRPPILRQGSKRQL